jgi:hypothetical protein
MISAQRGARQDTRIRIYLREEKRKEEEKAYDSEEITTKAAK